MSASENTRPATDGIKYEYTGKSDCAKSEPIRYLIPDGFNNQPFNGDRQFVNFESNQQMFGGTNAGEQRVNDSLPDEVTTKVPETYRTLRTMDSADPFGRNLYNSPYVHETLKSNCGGREGFKTNSKDDRILDIALSIIVAILLIYVIYKFFIVKTFKTTLPETQTEVAVEEIEEV